MTAEKDRLVTNVLNLNKKVAYPKPSRTEPRNEVSEFHLVKSAKAKGNVRVNELTDAFNKQTKQSNVRQKIKTFEKKLKPLPKPLEKVKADRIHRSTAFSKVKEHLNRWNAVVTSNRASNHLTFPLQDDLNLESGKNFTAFRIKSELQKKLEAFEQPSEEFKLDKSSKYPITMQEMLERRKEMMKLKAIESQKAAKARRQNKIKSKKYHRIQRREKIKNQIKEFETLQQSNPEEALKKLAEIDRVRAEERASLRHRNTGKWAKSKQIKAKYDSTNRQELAQQLAISRELTQKMKEDERNSESEEENASNESVLRDKNNPWVNEVKTTEEVDQFLRSYRKFWEEKNAQLSDINRDSLREKVDVGSLAIESTPEELSSSAEPSSVQDAKVEYKEMTEKAKKFKKRSSRQLNGKNENIDLNTKTICMATSQWEIGIISDTDSECDDIDALFDKYRDKAKKKMDTVKESVKLNEKCVQKRSQKAKKSKSSSEDLSIKLEARHPIIDESLNENVHHREIEKETESETSLLLALRKETQPATSKPKNIDPNDILCTKPVDLDTELPDLVGAYDNEENEDQMGAIVEAFQDDNIVESFLKEKENEIDRERPTDIDLTLPGWGAWGGPGVVQSMKKKKQQRRNGRFIIKFPKEFKRKDENKGNLVINERPNEKVKKHLVSDVPFPFKTVKDFEASIRTPIGNTFVPETAFRRMIKPAVSTKLGTVIEPMTEDILLKKK